MNGNKEQLEARVVRAAEAALADHQFVSLIDVLTGMNLLAHSNVEAWRKGRLEHLEEMIQGSAEKISVSIATFHRWAAEKGLRPVEVRYQRPARGSELVDLRFSVSGDPEVERVFRTHFVSPLLAAPKQEKLKDRMSKPAERVVFQIVRASKCSECGTEIERDDLLFMDADQPLCMACAGLGDLEFLGAGDAAMTRRASKYSERKAVVVKFSRSRGRYERRGILVETPALERAERECLEDAGDRARARAKAAEQRRGEDREFVARMADAIRELFPRCPPAEARRIAAHAAARGSGRVGRTAAGRNLEEEALMAAVVASIRHNQTDYDELLASGVERATAREKVSDRIEEVLESWRGLR